MTAQRRHGQVRVWYGPSGRQQSRMVPLDPIVYTVRDLLSWGVVLQVEQTIAGRRCWVIAGPYQAQPHTAHRYAVFVGDACSPFLDPLVAARAFVSWVGRDAARDAVRAVAQR
jgi:hypothetical protein